MPPSWSQPQWPSLPTRPPLLTPRSAVTLLVAASLTVIASPQSGHLPPPCLWAHSRSKPDWSYLGTSQLCLGHLLAVAMVLGGSTELCPPGLLLRALRSSGGFFFSCKIKSSSFCSGGGSLLWGRGATAEQGRGGLCLEKSAVFPEGQLVPQGSHCPPLHGHTPVGGAPGRGCGRELQPAAGEVPPQTAPSQEENGAGW